MPRIIRVCLRIVEIRSLEKYVKKINFRSRGFLRKLFNAKIYLTENFQHENFPIYGNRRTKVKRGNSDHGVIPVAEVIS